MADARYRWTRLDAGAFRLDAGSMFGLIPKSVWSRDLTVDDKNRMELRHNCLLLERVGPGGGPGGGAGLAGPRRVLVEAGTGDKLDAKSRGLFAMEETSVEAALLAAGVEAGAVELAVVSHLHFDHAGGLTRRARAGETPDWVGPASSFGAARGDEPVKVTFPNAKVVVQKREWEDAVAGRSVMTRTYFADHVEPLSDRVALVDSPPPFAAGYVPGREELPGTPQGARETEIAPGLFVFRVPGHTWGQQAVRFEDEQGRTIVFTPDVIPTARHVGQAYSLAYDVEPYTSMVTRGWLLAEAAAKGWCLFLNHEPGEPLRRVVRSGAWFETPVT